MAIPSTVATKENVRTSVWHVACSLVYEELAAGRGVVVDGLGTFTIDIREKYHGAAAGTTIERRPALVLSRAFEGLGVRPPAAKPGGKTHTHMIKWRTLGDRCSLDRDLARRTVASTLSGFASKVAGMATATARSSSAVLDLGPCGTLRIVRCGDHMRAGLEMRVTFSSELLAAVSSGPAVTADADWRPLHAASVELESELAAAFADMANGGGDENAKPQPAARKPTASQEFVTLEGLSQLQPGSKQWASCVAASAPPPPPQAASSAAAALAVIKAAAAKAAQLQEAAAALEAEEEAEGREPLLERHALPMPSVEVDEWAVRKLQTSRDVGCAKANYEATRVLTGEERRRRTALDIDNLRLARARALDRRATTLEKLDSKRTQRGVDKLLRRLKPADAAAADLMPSPLRCASPLTKGPLNTAIVADVSDGGVAAELLLRKLELQARVKALEKEIDAVSVTSSRRGRC